MKKEIISAVAAAVMIGASGCSEANNAKVETTPSDKVFTAADEYVKEIGRTYLADDGVLWMVHSASGIEFSFTGTKASVVLVGDSNSANAWGKDNYARYAIYVDGKRISDDMMNEAKRTVDIFSSESEKETTVKILKLSECANSTLGIESINVTSIGDIKPTADKALKIEFIGDSITCGYGVDDEVKENHFKTDTEDATKAYAYKTAELLDADYSLVSYSGNGIVSGYTTNGKAQKAQRIPDFYAKLGKSNSKSGSFSVGDIDWNFSSFVPDVVVINLGTNDASYTGNDEEKQREYIDGYVKFLGDIREKNADSYIVCTLGIMGDTLYPAVETAVSEYTAQSGDTKVTAVRFDVQNGAEDGYAADWHPTERTHTKAADKLAAEIKTILGI